MTAATPPPGWGRGRLVAVAAGATAAVVALVAGLAYLLWDGATHTPAGRTGHPAVAGATVDPRDAIAAAPMPAAARSASRGGSPAASPAPTVLVPPATRSGPAGVPTGFPHTPAGALGQLAAIDTTTLTGMSLDTARAVHAGWALPGAPPVRDWVVTANVQAFTAAAGPAPAGLPATAWATPVGGQVKGSDGPDWVLACVLLRVDAALARTAAIAWGHCERMAWVHDRWQIAPGAPPAPAPSTWPGTLEATAAGWRTWAEPEPESAR